MMENVMFWEPPGAVIMENLNVFGFGTARRGNNGKRTVFGAARRGNNGKRIVFGAARRGNIGKRNFFELPAPKKHHQLQ
jgi:hypothetical protein